MIDEINSRNTKKETKITAENAIRFARESGLSCVIFPDFAFVRPHRRAYSDIRRMPPPPAEKNLAGLADLSGRWIELVHARCPPRGILLDMDSSVSPTHGEQEMSAWNGQYECVCYHPLFLFNQFGVAACHTWIAQSGAGAYALR